MTMKALIVGDHPLAESLVQQYEARQYDVTRLESVMPPLHINDFDELCLLPGDKPAAGGTAPADGGAVTADVDADALEQLRRMAEDYAPEEHEGRKLLCHLLLHRQRMLWLLQTLNVFQDLSKKVELYPFTMEDLWAKNVLSHIPLSPLTPHVSPLTSRRYPSLDWQPVTAASNKTVHFLIYGFGEMAESLALHAALIAHYPNYERLHTLRTRITILDPQIETRRNAFMQRYKNLFDHSYYRFIELGNVCAQTCFHKPAYSRTREDFVDVEWEFVKGDLSEPVMQDKLRLWITDRNQLLTIALCTARPDVNTDSAFMLPAEIRQRKNPVLVYVNNAAILDEVRQKPDYDHLYPFGMDDCGYDTRLPLLQMAKRLHYFYQCSFGMKGVPTEMPADQIEEEWRLIETFNLRYSNINNVMTIATKMRSLGHDESDWARFYALTQEEVEQLSAVEHNRWCVERLIAGFRPPTDQERDEIRQNIQQFIAARQNGEALPECDLKNTYKKQKVHYDLCSYRELGRDKTGQDVRKYDYDLTASIPLITSSFKIEN